MNILEPRGKVLPFKKRAVARKKPETPKFDDPSSPLHEALHKSLWQSRDENKRIEMACVVRGHGGHGLPHAVICCDATFQRWLEMALKAIPFLHELER